MKTKIIITFLSIVLILVLGVAGYSLYLNIQQKKANENLASELNKALQQSNEYLQQQIQDLSSRILELELNEILKSHESVVIDTSSKGYQRIDTASGSFLISFEDAKSYLNGYKLIFNIGNPTSATYTGFTLKVNWGKQWNSKEWKTVDEWQKSLKEKEEPFTTKELKPGYWNKVELIISPAKPEELGYLELSMDTKGMTLYQDR